jgi:hypothetical protein
MGEHADLSHINREELIKIMDALADLINVLGDLDVSFLGPSAWIPLSMLWALIAYLGIANIPNATHFWKRVKQTLRWKQLVGSEHCTVTDTDTHLQGVGKDGETIRLVKSKWFYLGKKPPFYATAQEQVVAAREDGKIFREPLNINDFLSGPDPESIFDASLFRSEVGEGDSGDGSDVLQQLEKLEIAKENLQILINKLAIKPVDNVPLQVEGQDVQHTDKTNKQVL